MISQTAEYALRAVVSLADQGEAKTTQQLAGVTRVPAGYLAKVMQCLARAGLVTSQRGLHGGFRLAKSPDELTIWEVVEAVDPIQRIRVCPLGLPSHGAKLCPVHRRLDDAAALVENAFRNSTVRDLLDDSSSSTPLCGEPGRPERKPA